ncbi:hypothetical protein RB600_000838 [Gaeumannomyces tritici]
MEVDKLSKFVNYSPARRDCRAAIHFANPAFPPITYLHSSGSCHFGSENASFQVPIGVPSGDAFVTWTCGAVTHTCVRAVISEGRGTPKPPSLLDGAISCERWPKRNKTSSPAPSINSTDNGISSNKPPSSFTAIVAPTSFGSVTSSSLPVPSREGQPISGSGASNSAERSTGGDGFIQVSSASRITVPDVARSLLTVTRTVTTLFTTTLTADAR